MKHKWTLVGFILSLILILTGYILLLIILLQKKLENNQIIIGAVGEGISFFGTMFLGMVSYWQTRTANEISKAQMRRDMVTNLVLQGNVNLCPVEIIPKKIFNSSIELQPEGIYCSYKHLCEFDEMKKEKFFGFMFQMNSVGAPLDKFVINDVKINKLLADKTYGKEYYVDLQLLNIHNDVIFSYNPQKKCYIIRLYINIDEAHYDKLIKDGLLVIDLDFNVVSSYGTTLQHKFSINFEQTDTVTSALQNGKNSSQNVKLENVLVFKGEPQYGNN